MKSGRRSGGSVEVGSGLMGRLKGMRGGGMSLVVSWFLRGIVRRFRAGRGREKESGDGIEG